MKQLFTFLICGFMLSYINAQAIDDNLDSHAIGPIGDLAPWWTTWSGITGTAEDLQIVNSIAHSPPNSGYVSADGMSDVLLLLGNRHVGQYQLSWYMYVTTGSTAYWNIQEDETPGVQWNADFYVGATASGGKTGKITHDQSGNTISFPADKWFLVDFNFDMDALTFSLDINGNDFLIDEPLPGSKLGSINFFSIDENNNYYIDDVHYMDPIIGFDQYNLNKVSVYLNARQDILNIITTAVVETVNIYDVLGKLVLQAQPDRVSPSINMSALSSGAYMVQVTIGNTTKTVKVVK